MLELSGVAAAAAAARDAVDGRVPPVAALRAELTLRAACDSAALEGAVHEPEAVRAGIITDPVVHGAVRVAAALPGLAAVWRRAPWQALAAIHVLAGRGVLPEGELGRPVWGSDDTSGPARLAALRSIVVTPVTEATPAVIVAAVVHAEILDIAPFTSLNGVVARAAARLCMSSLGLDVENLSVPESVHRERKVEYVGSLGAYATGRPDGVRAWLKHCCLAVERGTQVAGLSRQA